MSFAPGVNRERSASAPRFRGRRCRAKTQEAVALRLVADIAGIFSEFIPIDIVNVLFFADVNGFDVEAPRAFSLHVYLKQAALQIVADPKKSEYIIHPREHDAPKCEGPV
ncbi:hypothetical protein F2P81_024457 [Scophthalmus maximus]|uniref:Uncharacterized protein n=1 Tax=Scophthalmus maximus TaxID=52904 RepID=A0A6A4RU40_SCOMX|nr:hypothetical protein F2P81_024457 [Scophthalmus maximus]